MSSFREQFDRIEKLAAVMQQESIDVRRDEQSDRWSIRDRAIEALQSVGRYSLANKMKECRAGARCASLWCPECQSSVWDAHCNDVLDSVSSHSWAKEDLYHLTAHLGVINVDGNEVESLKGAIQRDDRVWRRFRARAKKIDGLWVRAVYEFELVNVPYLLRASGDDEQVKKRTQLLQMMDDRSKFGDLVIYFHWHGFSSLHPKEWMDEDYFINGKKTFKSNDSGVYVQEFHKDKSLEASLKTLCRYPLKNSVRFKHSFVGSDHKSGEKMTNEELSCLVSLYDAVQGRGRKSLFRSIG